MIKRYIKKDIDKFGKNVPVTGIIGARQVGKTTLAKDLIAGDPNSVFIDLEKSSDRNIMAETESFLQLNKDKIICIDEIQMMPEILFELRNFVDNHKNARIILLGSSSPDLLNKSSESLAGRIFYFELTPFLWTEIKHDHKMEKYRLVGGLPQSLLSKTTEESFYWLENFIRTFLERDLRNFGFNIPSETLRRLWKMLAHLNGQTLNNSQIALSMGLSHTSIRHYIDILMKTFMIRLIEPYHHNIKKRLIKSPKVYFRDTGILHSLLKIDSFEDLHNHPIYGSSWETIVIENIIAKYHKWNHYYYRTSNGNEIDLILTKANRIIAIEIKASPTPKLSRGFWLALEDVKATEAYVIAPVRMTYPMKNKVMVYSLEDFLEFENE